MTLGTPTLLPADTMVSLASTVRQQTESLRKLTATIADIQSSLLEMKLSVARIEQQANLLPMPHRTQVLNTETTIAVAIKEGDVEEDVTAVAEEILIVDPATPIIAVDKVPTLTDVTNTEIAIKEYRAEEDVNDAAEGKLIVHPSTISLFVQSQRPAESLPLPQMPSNIAVSVPFLPVANSGFVDAIVFKDNEVQEPKSTIDIGFVCNKLTTVEVSLNGNADVWRKSTDQGMLSGNSLIPMVNVMDDSADLSQLLPPVHGFQTLENECPPIVCLNASLSLASYFADFLSFSGCQHHLINFPEAEFSHGIKKKPPPLPPEIIQERCYTNMQCVRFHNFLSGGRNDIEYECLKGGVIVILKLVGNFQNGAVFGNRGNEVEKSHFVFNTHDNQVVDDLPKTAMKMKNYEIALVTPSCGYTFGAVEFQQNLSFVPPNSTVFDEVELFSFTEESDSWDMNTETEENIPNPNQKKGEGNALVQIRTFISASKKYKHMGYDFSFGLDEKKQNKALRVSYHLKALYEDHFSSLNITGRQTTTMVIFSFDLEDKVIFKGDGMLRMGLV